MEGNRSLKEFIIIFNVFKLNYIPKKKKFGVNNGLIILMLCNDAQFFFKIVVIY